jgi:hypothetical protein
MEPPSKLLHGNACADGPNPQHVVWQKRLEYLGAHGVADRQLLLTHPPKTGRRDRLPYVAFGQRTLAEKSFTPLPD